MDEEQKDYSDTIRTSAEALLTIINDILDFSKVEAGKLHIDTMDFNLREVVEETLDVLAEQARNKGIELVFFLPTDLPVRLRGDPGRLRQVLLNLTGNAIKFTEKGEVYVRVEALQETGETCQMRFSIQDTGIGIDKATQKKLFQPFQQADNSTTRKYGGTGLGLAISRQLVELMGGTISLESTPGTGSTFFITIRFTKQSTFAVEKPSDLEHLKDRRVLVLDDNATNLKVLQRYLNSWQMEVETFADPSKAWDRLSQKDLGSFDLAIADLQMPELDGFGWVQQIRQIPHLEGMKILVASSSGKRVDFEELRAMGVDAMVLKPIKQSQLFDVILHLLAVQPCKSAENQEILIAELDPSSDSHPSVHLGHILIVEDNLVNQKVTTQQLKKLGYNSTVVPNGQEACHAMQRRSFDLVLMDCQMPVMDGYAATRQIRSMEQDGERGTVIVAMTANAMESDRQRCLEVGMDDFISKPVRLASLKDVLQRHLGSTAGRMEHRTGNGEARREHLLNLNALEALRNLRTEGEPDPLAEIIDLFLEHAPELISQIQHSAEKRRWELLAKGAHSLKGSCSNVGADQMCQICLKLEKAAGNQTREAALQLSHQLKQCFDQIRDALATERTR